MTLDRDATHDASSSASHHMWGGRFGTPPDEALAALNDSLPVDRRLWMQDIRGSKAWVTALHEASVLDPDERTAHAPHPQHAPELKHQRASRRRGEKSAAQRHIKRAQYAEAFAAASVEPGKALHLSGDAPKEHPPLPYGGHVYAERIDVQRWPTLCETAHELHVGVTAVVVPPVGIAEAEHRIKGSKFHGDHVKHTERIRPSLSTTSANESNSAKAARASPAASARDD